MSEELAQLFHETYERLAPSFGYETRKDSAKPWADVPDKNKRLMIAVCAEIRVALKSGDKGREAEDENPLDKAWYEINALGGLPSTPEDKAYVRAIFDCLAVIEEQGGMDPLQRNADPRTPDYGVAK